VRYALQFFVLAAAVGCVDTTRDNVNDPGSVTHDAGRPPANDTGTLPDPADAGPADAGPSGDECDVDSLMLCYEVYRAFDAVCVRGLCAVPRNGLSPEILTGLETSAGHTAREACAAACHPSQQPGLCTFNFNNSGIDFATCKDVARPPNECPGGLGNGDVDSANHRVCRLRCDWNDTADESNCVTHRIEDRLDDQVIQFSESCDGDGRCSNSGGHEGCNADLDLGRYCGNSISPCADRAACSDQFNDNQSTFNCIDVSIVVVPAIDFDTKMCVGKSCNFGDESSCPPGTFCNDDNSTTSCRPAPFCSGPQQCSNGLPCVGFGGNHPRACIALASGCGNCNESQVCFLGRCLQPMTGEGQCPNDFFEVTGMCRPDHNGPPNECETTDDCPLDRIADMHLDCINGRCVRSCSFEDPNSCSSTIMGTECATIPDSGDEFVCGCSSSDDCTSSWLPRCDEGESRCVGCTGDGDTSCPEDEFCVGQGGSCTMACTVDNNCVEAAPGARCIVSGGLSFCGCNSNQDCLDGLACSGQTKTCGIDWGG
jgi:hypothetical protein